MNRIRPVGSAPTTMDRVGHAMTRHPWWTGVTMAVTFFGLQMLFGTMFGVGAAGRPGIVTTAVGSAAFGAAMVGVQRLSPAVRGNLDLDQWSRLRQAVRAAHRGERPVALEPELAALALRTAHVQATRDRQVRPALFVLAVCVLTFGSVLVLLQYVYLPESHPWLTAVVMLAATCAITVTAILGPRQSARTLANLKKAYGSMI